MLEIEHLPETTYTSVGGFLFDLSEELPVQGKVIKYSTIDERVVDGLYVSVPVEIHFTLTKVEDNRIKEIFVKVVDVDASADKKDETHESLIEKHKKKRQKKAESKNSDN